MRAGVCVCIRSRVCVCVCVYAYFCTSISADVFRRVHAVTTRWRIGFYCLHDSHGAEQATAAEYVWCILRPYGTGRISYLGIARAHILTHTHTRVCRQRLRSRRVRVCMRIREYVSV